MKTCPTCGDTDPESFGRDRSRSDGRNKYCRPCHRSYQGVYRKLYWEKALATEHKSRTKLIYKTTVETIEQLLQKQGYKCAFPSCPIMHTKAKRLCTDHNHETVEIRGMLCREHNLLLGFAQDSSAVLTEAIHYLKGEH